MKRCGWCGMFVREDTEPITGPNYHGVQVAQTLCPEHAGNWRQLIERNMEHLGTRSTSPG